jgi:twin arginine-targeting protein translocase tatC
MFEELRPHLIELRKRLFISIVSVFVCFGICFTFWNPLLAWMSEPLKQVLPAGSNIIFTQIQEPFFTAMKVAFFAGRGRFAYHFLAVLAICRTWTL